MNLFGTISNVFLQRQAEFISNLMAWETYFPEIPSPSDKFENAEFTKNDHLNLSSGNYYIRNCLFYDLLVSTNGGAICLTTLTSTEDKYILVEYSSISRSRIESVEQVYGSIYISSAHTVLNHLCGEYCYSSYNDCFSHIQSPTKSYSINTMCESSIVRCETEHETVCYNGYGHGIYKNNNFSLNVCMYNSPIAIYHDVNDTDGFVCNMKFASVSNNTATATKVILAFCYHVNYRFMKTNIVNNVQLLNYDGILQSTGPVYIYDTCIMGNIASTYIFNIHSPYSYYLFNCSVDAFSAPAGALQTSEIGTKTFVNYISFINTRSCQAFYDVVGTLTPEYIPKFTERYHKKIINPYAFLY